MVREGNLCTDSEVSPYYYIIVFAVQKKLFEIIKPFFDFLTQETTHTEKQS